MDIKTAEAIKANKGILRQLTYLNNEVKKLKCRTQYLPYPTEQELQEMNLYEGSD